MYYLDHNATSPIFSSVKESVLPYITDEFGNPSSSNPFAKRAKEAIEEARHHLSELIGVQSREVLFTSGGTEAIYGALVGVFRANNKKRHLVVSAVEHIAVFKCAELLKDLFGIEVSIVPVDSNGLLELDKLASAIREDTGVVSIIYANNETGVISPISEIGEICRRRGVLLHVDAVQAVGKIPVSFNTDEIDLLSLSAHKFGGLKGTGALIVRSGTKWLPLLEGGFQEGGRRGGTEGVVGIVALGEAARLKNNFVFGGGVEQMRQLRKSFEERILNEIPQAFLNVKHNLKLPNTISVGFDGVRGIELIEILKSKEIYVSAGAACKTGSVEPSPVLTAYGISSVKALQTIRISFGEDLQNSDIATITGILKESVESILQVKI